MRIVLAASLVTLGLCLPSQEAWSASGDPDPAFGDEGVAVAVFTEGFSEASCAVRQADGKIVAAGPTAPTFSDPYSIAIARFNADGSLDPGFGGDGTVVTDVAPSYDYAVQVLAQSDGKLVVVAQSEMTGDFENSEISLVRYNTDGTLDATFGTGGKVTTAIGSGRDGPGAATLQADDRIVVIGYTVGVTTDELVARFDSAGALDPTFGTGGIVALDFDGRNDSGAAVAVQSDGSIVVAGTSYNGNFFGDGTVATLARLDASGTLDPAFGTAGRVVESVAYNSLFQALAIQTDGSIVAYGATGYLQNLTFRLFRYDASGTADPGFAGGPTDFSPTGAPGTLALGASDEFAAVGDGFGVVRIAGDGTVDESFGIGGRMYLSGVSMGYAQAALIEPSRDIILAGSSIPDLEAPQVSMTVARLKGAGESCITDSDCGACEYCSAGACTIGSRTGCIVAATGDARMKVVRKYPPEKRKLSVKWKGTVPPVDPAASDDVTICVYKGTERVMKVRTPAGGTCGTQDCWTAHGDSGYSYLDRARTSDGVKTIKITPDGFRASAAGLELSDTIDNVPIAYTLDVPADPILLQIHAGDDACLQASFDSNRRLKGTTFVGTSD